MPDKKKLSDIADEQKVSQDHISYVIDRAKASLTSLSKDINVEEGGVKKKLIVTRVGFGILNTDYGAFSQFDFIINDEWEKYSVLVKADLDETFNPVFKGEDPVLIRIDSGCETGQLFGDRTCECREQLELAMEDIKNSGEGIIIHIPRQDARGLGLPFKLATLTLQDKLGVDTVTAANMLADNGNIDTRTYAGVAAILKFFGVSPETELNLATNNPAKAAIFPENGFKVAKFVPIVIEPTPLTRKHLLAKQEELGHINLIMRKEDKPVRNFMQMLDASITRSKSLVCCGLDPNITKMPKEITEKTSTERGKALDFLTSVVDMTSQHVCAYKLQKAFFDVFDDGEKLLIETVRYIKTKYPTIPIILDSKIGDISNTMEAYLHSIFDKIGVDAVIVNPYMGDDVIAPFKDFKDKAAIVLVKTSNPGGDVIQDILTSKGIPLWQHVLRLVVERWGSFKNIIPVISTTEELDFAEVRKIVPLNTPIFLAGFGAQGGKLNNLSQILGGRSRGAIVNSSREILYPYETEDPDWRLKIENSVIRMKTYLNSQRGSSDD
jgi:orotidine-5'-phosphate decarboxylase